MRKGLIIFWWVYFLCTSLNSRDIVVGIEPKPIKKYAFLLTPVVLPDLLSAKAAFEYRIHKKFNLIIPLEAKWMDYRWAIKTGAKIFGASDQNVPESWYQEGNTVRPGWNIDFMQFKISSGIGLKWFPFSESNTNAFFIKTLFLAGIEHFNAYAAEGKRDSAVLTPVMTIGYNWVKREKFVFGFEVGGEYVFHTNPIKNLPILVNGFVPVAQFSLGFTI